MNYIFISGNYFEVADYKPSIKGRYVITLAGDYKSIKEFFISDLCDWHKNRVEFNISEVLSIPFINKINIINFGDGAAFNFEFEFVD